MSIPRRCTHTHACSAHSLKLHGVNSMDSENRRRLVILLGPANCCLQARKGFVRLLRGRCIIAVCGYDTRYAEELPRLTMSVTSASGRRPACCRALMCKIGSQPNSTIVLWPICIPPNVSTELHGTLSCRGCAPLTTPTLLGCQMLKQSRASWDKR